MSDVAGALNRATPGDTALGFTFDLLLTTLPAPLASLLRLVAIPHEFDSAIVQALDPSLTGATAQEACEKLSRLSIVRRLPAAFALHDSARQHLFTEWLVPDRAGQLRSVSRRLADLFQHSAGNDALRNIWIFHLIGADPPRGFSEFEATCGEERRKSRLSECRTLINLVHEYDAMLTDGQLAALGYQEGRLAADLCDWDDAAAHLSAVTSNPACTTPLRVRADRWLGIVDRERRRFNDSIDRLTATVALAEQTPECREEVDDLLRDLAVSYREAGNFARAELLLKESIARAEETHDTQSLAAGWNSLGTLYSRRHQYKDAIAAFNEATNCLDGSPDRASIAQLKNNLAMAYVDAGDLPRGAELLSESLEIKRAIGDTRGQAVTLGNLADLYARRGDVTEALKTGNDSVLAFQSVRDHYAAAQIARNLGRAFRRSHDFEAARNSLSQAVDLFRASGEENAAVGTESEIARLGAHVRLPWWAWLLIALPFLLIGSIVALVMSVDRVRDYSRTSRQPATIAPPSNAVRELSVNGVPITGTLDADGRSTWFLFSTAGGSYVIEADSDVGDTVLLVYAEHPFRFIAEDDDSGGKEFSSKLNVTLASGRYYVEIRDYYSRSVSFTVRASLVAK